MMPGDEVDGRFVIASPLFRHEVFEPTRKYFLIGERSFPGNPKGSSHAEVLAHCFPVEA